MNARIEIWSKTQFGVTEISCVCLHVHVFRATAWCSNNVFSVKLLFNSLRYRENNSESLVTVTISEMVDVSTFIEAFPAVCWYVVAICFSQWDMLTMYGMCLGIVAGKLMLSIDVQYTWYLWFSCRRMFVLEIVFGFILSFCFWKRRINFIFTT